MANGPHVLRIYPLVQRLEVIHSSQLLPQLGYGALARRDLVEMTLQVDHAEVLVHS